MTLSTNLSDYVRWSGILTVVCLVLTIIAFLVKWGFRFRLVGATSFMAVLTAGLFALGLGLFVRADIPGAARYTLVYDNGANRAVIAVPPSITKDAIEPTLRQAAADLFSFGRNGLGEDQLIIRLRTVIHPKPGLSQPIYLGQIKRALATRDDENMNIEIFNRNLNVLKN